jgi:hypothetical protein
MFSAAAYIVPAALVWAGLAGLLAWLPISPAWLTLLGLVYALGYGIAESLGLLMRPPTIAWQVPQSWVAGRTLVGRTLIWGSVLGPGLLTINPYASFWLLPILITIVAHAHPLLPAASVGLLVGSSHGAGRVLGIWRNERQQQAQCGSPVITFTIMTRHFWWRLLDGRLLLAAAGAIAIYLALVLGSRL